VVAALLGALTIPDVEPRRLIKALNKAMSLSLALGASEDIVFAQFASAVAQLRADWEELKTAAAANRRSRANVPVKAIARRRVRGGRSAHVLRTAELCRLLACAIVCAMVRSACNGGFCPKSSSQPTRPITRRASRNQPLCRRFFERSGAGVEPTERWVAPPHWF
jgi:hypothetical protein